ncbi:replication initiation protein [Nocardia asteroides]|uniref:replication initiation protein n=1 Tax=Nocardia asteroides TaxID=1824 RepID=UPI0034294968
MHISTYFMPIRLGASYYINRLAREGGGKYLIRLGASYYINRSKWGRLLVMQIEIDDAEWIDVDSPPLPFEEHWLPRRPLAGHRKTGGYYRTTRERALTMPYIESNPKALRSLVITDHDGGRADEIVGMCGLPQPSYISMNPVTRDGHIVYVLDKPVCLTDAARRRPVNLLASIEAGLNDVLSGDVAYGGRITKNPRHADHLTLFGPNWAVYRMEDLAKPLRELKALPKWAGVRERRRKLQSTDTGRNVELFECVRCWAYPHRGDYTDLGRWKDAVDDYAWDRNVEVLSPNFSKGPLDAAEVSQVARSISTWTWRHIKRSFSEEQARRGRNGGKKMTAAKREANRVRATKYDMNAIVAAALEV